MIPVTVLPDLPPARIPPAAMIGTLVARKAWPMNPCNGHEQVATTRYPIPMAGLAHVERDDRFIGLADLNGKRCLIWLRAGMSRLDTCSAMVHEAGHWAGMEHADARLFPIMAATYAAPDPDCEVPR